MKRRMKAAGTMQERKKNQSDPIAHPVIMFSQQENPSKVLDNLEKFARKVVRQPKGAAAKLDNPPTVAYSDPDALKVLSKKLIKLIIAENILTEEKMSILFEATRLANPQLDDEDLENIFKFIKEEVL